MLQIARQEFIPPDDCEKQTVNKKPDNTEDFTMPVLYKEATISGTKDEILFCDFLLYWLHLIRNSIDKSTFSSYQNVIERHIIPYFQPKNYTCLLYTSRCV